MNFLIAPLKSSLFVLAFTVLSGPGFGQSHPGAGGARQTASGNPDGVLSGTVVDRQNGHPVEYANVVLYRSRDSVMVHGGITDGKGVFRLTGVPYGKFYAVVSFLGYDMMRLPDIAVNPNKLQVDLGRIVLESSSTRLTEVTITGERPAMEYSLDRKVINVEKNIATMGGSAVDVLQNVPSVTVDENGAVSLRGDANVTLLIDGRPSGLTGTKLEQIPASSIETIELITNPSARYNPEGMSGIINIKLKKKRERGFNGLVSLNAGTRDKYNGSVNLNYNIGRVNFFGSVDGRADTRTGTGDMNRKTFYDDSISIVKQLSDNRRKRTSAGIKAGVDLSLDDRNSLLLSVMNNRGPGRMNEFSDTYSYNGRDSLLTNYTITSEELDEDLGYDYVLNYRRTFAGPGQELTLDVVYNTSEEEESEDIVQHNVIDTITPPLQPYPQRTETTERRENANIQLNYIHPLGEGMKLEGGYQGIIRSTDNDYLYSLFNPTLQAWAEDPGQSNRFLYKENIHALYAIFGLTREQYSLQAGIRAENAATNSESKTMDTVFDKNYTSFYPSLHATHKLPGNQEVQLSYSRRVNRPNMRALNPFIDKSNPLSLHYGNPDLNPEYISVYEVGYSKYFKKSTFNTSVFYRDIKDVIKRYVFVDTAGPQEVYHITTLNLSSGVSYGIELVLDHQFFKWWRVNANFSYFKTKINGDNVSNSLTNENTSWTSRLNNSFVLPGKWMIQLNAFYRGPMVNPQGTVEEMFGSDIAVRKEFWKDKASVSFRLSDIFDTQQFNVRNSDTGFEARMKHKRESRVAFLGFTYKIGKNGIKQKKIRKSEENGRDSMEDMDF